MAIGNDIVVHRMSRDTGSSARVSGIRLDGYRDVVEHAPGREVREALGHVRESLEHARRLGAETFATTPLHVYHGDLPTDPMIHRSSLFLTRRNRPDLGIVRAPDVIAHEIGHGLELERLGNTSVASRVLPGGRMRAFERVAVGEGIADMFAGLHTRSWQLAFGADEPIRDALAGVAYGTGGSPLGLARLSDLEGPAVGIAASPHVYGSRLASALAGVQTMTGWDEAGTVFARTLDVLDSTRGPIGVDDGARSLLAATGDVLGTGHGATKHAAELLHGATILR